MPVPYQTMNQLGIDHVTNLPVTPEGYYTIVTAVDYTSKWVECRTRKEKFAEGVAEFLYDLVCHFGASEILHNPVYRNCAIAVLTVKPHIITSTELYCQGIAPGSQYSDLTPEAAMLH